MIMDCLASQSIGTAYPHIMGIITGHLFHFFSHLSQNPRNIFTEPPAVLVSYGRKIYDDINKRRLTNKIRSKKKSSVRILGSK